MSESYVPLPQKSAVQMAERLREEIAAWTRVIEREKERRQRRALLNEQKHEAAVTEDDKARALATWVYENQVDGQEIACHEARLGEHRRLLQ